MIRDCIGLIRVVGAKARLCELKTKGVRGIREYRENIILQKKKDVDETMDRDKLMCVYGRRFKNIKIVPSSKTPSFIYGSLLSIRTFGNIIFYFSKIWFMIIILKSSINLFPYVFLSASDHKY